MHGQWVGTYTDEEGGINIRAVFDKYDHDQSSDIDIAELKNVLEDLGVEATDERLHDAFSILDVNGDGVIAYDEFSNWWRKDSVTYTLKRSVEIIHTSSSSSSSSAVDAKNVLGSRGRTSMAPPIGSTLLGGGAASAAAAAAIKTSPLDNIIQSTNRVVRAVAVPIVTYRGNKTRYEVLGLIPNRLYHFKLRYVGSRSNSALSPPAVLMTAPLPPSPPIIIDVATNSVRVKWYAGQYGAFKFTLHLRPKIMISDVGRHRQHGDSNNNNNTSNSNTSNTSKKMIGTSIIGVDTGDDGWIAVYNGADNSCICSCLPADTTFEARVFALNCQGSPSESSDIITFSTLPRRDTTTTTTSAAITTEGGNNNNYTINLSMLTPKNAMEMFNIECTGDICVGDTILITERLYSKMTTVSSSVGDDYRTNTSIVTGGRSTSAVKNRSKSAANGTITTTTGQRYGSIANVNHSVTTLNSEAGGGGGVSITADRGQFIGERTIAGYVCRDNYRSIRDSLSSQGVEPKHTKRIGLFRSLWLEVIWQKSSNDACKPYDLKAGDVIERNQAHLEQFEVFRTKWKQEGMRKPFQDEWKIMMECYIQTEC